MNGKRPKDEGREVRVYSQQRGKRKWRKEKKKKVMLRKRVRN